MEIQIREISLAERLQYLESILVNQTINKTKPPWTIFIGCAIGVIVIGLLIRSAKLKSEKESKSLSITSNDTK
jgi:hypothetical protein